MRVFSRNRRWWLFGSIVVFVIIASACYQPAGSALESTFVAQSQPTFTDTPTITPLPTDTLVPTIEVTNTPEFALDTSTPTETPSPTFTLAPGFTEVAQVIEDPFALTATAYANQLLALTPGGQVVDPVQQQPEGQIDPIYLTATALIREATDTAFFPLTLTAAAQTAFAQIPTSTPTTQIITNPNPLPQPQGSDCIHEVRLRDRNLFRIALAYGVTVDQIAQATGLTNVNLIHAGDRLVIPGCGTTGFVPPPTSTPNPNATPGGGQPITCTSPYTVRQGDTLYRISLACGVTVRDIANINSIVVPDLIFVGEQLIIPGGGAG